MPALVLMAGLPGAGKTALALALGRELGWPVIDKDSVKTAMLEAGVSESIAGPMSYHVPLALCRDLLAIQRLSVILDSPAAYSTTVERARLIALEAEAELKFIYCHADAALRNQRLRHRPYRLSQMTHDPTPETAVNRFQHLPDTALQLEMNRSLDDLTREALGYLRQGQPLNPRSA